MDLNPRHIGLFLDVDGTLLDLAPTPDAVEVPAALLHDLAGAERRLGGALALVSGRPIEELDRLFAPLRLRASGVHGAEIRQSGEAQTTWLARNRLPPEAWQALLDLLHGFPDTFAENKCVGFTVHHRFVDADKAPLAAALAGLIARFPSFRLELVPGRRVFELRAPGFHKGTAIERFMAGPPFAGRRPIFVADDQMDDPGFNAVLALGGLAYSVGEKRPGLTGWFPRPAAVREWLGQIAQ